MSSNPVKSEPGDQDGSNMRRAMRRFRAEAYSYARANGLPINEGTVMCIALIDYAEEIRRDDPVAAFAGMVAAIGKVSIKQGMTPETLKNAVCSVIDASIAQGEGFGQPEVIQEQAREH
jgi:hypothetical protein